MDDERREQLMREYYRRHPISYANNGAPLDEELELFAERLKMDALREKIDAAFSRAYMP